jgi:adenosyl cobinamide kinase/adenosyl cobinamide phosphate guanylyltransferase/sugar phosphate isomerase/epimerase
MKNLPFRLGTTSYIVPDEILPNVRYLAGKVRDIELVLFEVDEDEGGSQPYNNLPTQQVVDELNRLAGLYDLTYTVHLPLDLKLAADGSAQDQSLVKAKRVIEATRQLNPWAYVLHLDGREVRHSTDPTLLKNWQDQAVRALEIVAAWAGGPEKLAVENLEGYPPDFNQPVLDRIPVSRCVDIGHLWLDGVPVLPYLEKTLPRTRVIHIHGIGERDHASLRHVPAAELEAVLQKISSDYRGVLTLEIFCEPDFISSLEAVQQTLGQNSSPSAPLTFILGGARSGKSAYAQALASRIEGHILYVATAQAGDDEMKARIQAHRAERPAHWRTLEAPVNVGRAIQKALDEAPADAILLDCMTLLASNVILQLPEGATEREASDALLAEVDSLLACREKSNAHWIIVSNEVGLGLVPPYPLGRIYRDALGRANQKLASAATQAYFLVAGMALSLSLQSNL